MDPNTLLFLFVAGAVGAAENNAADTALMRAYVKQSGYDQRIKHLERRHFSKKTRAFMGYVGIIGKSIKEQQIVLTWTF